MRPTCLIACMALMGAIAARAEHPARPDGPVPDQADVLPAADEAALSQRLTAYYRRSGNAIVVATIKSLDGNSVENYANALYNEWGIGDARTDRGVLLLLAPNDRQARIEVGCGLEGTVTNGVAAQ